MNLKALERELQARARELLESGQVRMVAGFARGQEAARPIPVFIQSAQEVDRLVINAFCGATIGKYALDKAVAPAEEDGPALAMLVKGCDALALARLERDHRLTRDAVYLIALDCPGMVDGEKVRLRTGLAALAAEVTDDAVIVQTADGAVTLARDQCLMDKCLACEYPRPEQYDLMLGEPGPVRPVGRRDYARVAQLESLTADQRYAFWARQFQRCLRCFACRNACAACNCITCSLDDREVEWLGRDTQLAEQFMFHFTRAYHVAGRCVGCGECERVCPVGIPLMLLNEKLMRDIRDLFGVEHPEVPGEIEPLGQFNPEDPEGWREEEGQI